MHLPASLLVLHLLGKGNGAASDFLSVLDQMDPVPGSSVGGAVSVV